MVQWTAEGLEISVKRTMVENNDKQEKEDFGMLNFVQPKSLHEVSIIDDAAIGTGVSLTPVGKTEDGSSVSFSPPGMESLNKSLP